MICSCHMYCIVFVSCLHFLRSVFIILKGIYCLSKCVYYFKRHFDQRIRSSGNTAEVCARLKKMVPYGFMEDGGVYYDPYFLGETVSWCWTISLENVLSWIDELYLYGGSFYHSRGESLWLQSLPWNFRSSVSYTELMPRGTLRIKNTGWDQVI